MGFLSGGRDVASIVEEFSRFVVSGAGALTGTSDDGETVAIDPISAITLFTTILPVIFGWVKQCKGLKNDQVQGYVAQRHANPKTSAKQEADLQKKILVECRKLAKEEKRNAKATGIPADVGRYSIDERSAAKLAHNTIGQFSHADNLTVMKLVTACSTGA
jgi:hypothetical protein